MSSLAVIAMSRLEPWVMHCCLTGDSWKTPMLPAGKVASMPLQTLHRQLPIDLGPGAFVLLAAGRIIGMLVPKPLSSEAAQTAGWTIFLHEQGCPPCGTRF